MSKERKMTITLPREELMSSGHLACQGCGATLAMRYALKALGQKTILCIPACCWSVVDGPFPHSSLDVPIYHCAFETAASSASGVRAGLDMVGDKETTVMAWAGDGGTFDIGIQALSGAAERNEDFIYACYDNEAYMNTGIQRSSATPLGAWTTTTPVKHYKKERKKTSSALWPLMLFPTSPPPALPIRKTWLKNSKRLKTFMEPGLFISMPPAQLAGRVARTIRSSWPGWPFKPDISPCTK